MKELNCAHARSEIVNQLEKNYKGRVIYTHQYCEVTVLLLELYSARIDCDMACLVTVEEVDELHCKVIIKGAGCGGKMFKRSKGQEEAIEISAYNCVRMLDFK